MTYGDTNRRIGSKLLLSRSCPVWWSRQMPALRIPKPLTGSSCGQRRIDWVYRNSYKRWLIESRRRTTPIDQQLFNHSLTLMPYRILSLPSLVHQGGSAACIFLVWFDNQLSLQPAGLKIAVCVTSEHLLFLWHYHHISRSNNITNAGKAKKSGTGCRGACSARGPLLQMLIILKSLHTGRSDNSLATCLSNKSPR